MAKIKDVKGVKDGKEEKKYSGGDILDNKVAIPEGPDSWINFRKLWAYTGPGFLMSIAYLDPGNIESDLQSGAIASFRLIWVLLAAHIIGLALQRLSARLGVVSGLHMAEVAFYYYPRVPRIILWIMVEIAIIASDMQEVIGTAIALYLLTNQTIPLWAGVLITIADTFTFLFLDKYGVRKFELFFCLLISVMAITFGYEFIITKPELGPMAEGFLPWTFTYSKEQFIQGISVVGAVIMPHNLYLHSALVKSRAIDRTKPEAITQANKYFFIESTIALACSFVINFFVVVVFSVGFFDKTNIEIRDQCLSNNNHMPSYYMNTFGNNTNIAESDIYRGGVFLGCVFGVAGLYVWAIGIIASGQSSTMTGTYSGQFVMEGFLHIHISRWKRILITRSIAIVPTIAVVIYSKGVENITGLNDFLNCIQMLQLPFALLPALTFCADHRIMREYMVGTTQKYLCLLTSVVVIGINYYFLYDYVEDKFNNVYAWSFLGAFGTVYTLFGAYMFMYCLNALGIPVIPSKKTMFGRLFPNGKMEEFDAPWLKIYRPDHIDSISTDPEHASYCL